MSMFTDSISEEVTVSYNYLHLTVHYVSPWVLVPLFSSARSSCQSLHDSHPWRGIISTGENRGVVDTMM